MPYCAPPCLVHVWNVWSLWTGSCVWILVSETCVCLDSLHYTILLHYTTLHYTTLHYTTHHYTTLHTTTLHYTTLHYTTPHHTTLHHTTPHYTTPHYTTPQHTTLHYTTLHYTTLHYTTTLHDTTLHYTTLHYTTLHYTTRIRGANSQAPGARTRKPRRVFGRRRTRHPRSRPRGSGELSLADAATSQGTRSGNESETSGTWPPANSLGASGAAMSQGDGRGA